MIRAFLAAAFLLIGSACEADVVVWPFVRVYTPPKVVVVPSCCPSGLCCPDGPCCPKLQPVVVYPVYDPWPVYPRPKVYYVPVPVQPKPK